MVNLLFLLLGNKWDWNVSLILIVKKKRELES
jgi:hypothetical protein